jgi:shikimate kinase
MGVVLLGYRGSGKSSVGRKLADSLWGSFVDSDELIAKAAGRSIREIFEQDGEERFRDLESEAIGQALRGGADVVALGGGAVLREANRALLKSTPHKRIHLRCDPAVLHRRIHADPATSANRPALTALGGGLEEIVSLLATREPLYREVMTHELDVTDLGIDEAVVRITRML